MVTACQQGGRAALSCGASTRTAARSTYSSRGRTVVGLVDHGERSLPGDLISITAGQQNDRTVRIWAVDASNVLHSSAQISPGAMTAGRVQHVWRRPGVAAARLWPPPICPFSLVPSWGVDTSGNAAVGDLAADGPWFPWLPARQPHGRRPRTIAISVPPSS